MSDKKIVVVVVQRDMAGKARPELLVHTFLEFMGSPIAFTGDICRAFLPIWIRAEDRPSLVFMYGLYPDF